MDDDSAIEQNTSDPSNIDLTDNDGELNSLVEQLDLDSLRTLHLTSTQLIQLEEKTLHLAVNLQQIFVNTRPNTGEVEAPAFNLDRNFLANLPAHVKSIHLEGNSVTSIHPEMFQSQPLVEEIFLNDNALTSLDKNLFQGLTHLKKLVLDRNMLAILDDDLFAVISELESVSINENYFQVKKSLIDSFEASCPFEVFELTIEELEKEHEGEEEEKGESSEQLPEEEEEAVKVVKFEFIKNVRHLKNEFSLISLDPAKVATSVERNLMDKLMNVPLEGLVDLDLSKLNLKSGACLKLTRCFFAGLVSLESVDLEGNFISEMDPATFHNLPKLRKVNLKGNRLKILPACMFADSPMIQVVYLEKNNVEFIDPNAFNSCNELILVEISHNKIGRIQAGTFKDLPALTTLNLTSNRGEPMDLDVGAFENLPNLEHLYLNDNMIGELKDGVFRGLTNLILLDLSNNRIQKLNPEIFSDLESLQFINLDDNELSAPDVGLFKGLENLQNISMNGNGLENLEKLDLILEESVYYVSYRRGLGVKDSEHISEEKSEELNDIKRIKRAESIMSKASTITTIEI